MTNAERQRRYRERKRAEQRKPAPTASPSVTPPVTDADVTPDVPELGTRGARLWREVAAEGGNLRPAERVLLEEACRLADRLDRLDRILLGTADDWLRFHSANEDGTAVKVIVTGALVEVRQQQVALKALLAELRTSRAAAAAGGKPKVASAGRTTGGGDVDGGIADLTARIARRAQSAG